MHKSKPFEKTLKLLQKMQLTKTTEKMVSVMHF